MNKNRINRREFIGQSVAAGIGTSLAAKSVFSQNSPKPNAKVIKVTHPGAVLADGKVNPEIVKIILDRALCEFSGEQDVTKAWTKYISPEDIVGLKINTLGLRYVAKTNYIDHFHVVNKAISDGLVQAGCPEENIIVWDQKLENMRDGGFTPGTIGDTKIQCICAREDGSEEEPHMAGDKPAYLYKVLTRKISALVNIPLAKTHRMAGITGALKNHYGSLDNPNDFHANNCCNPGIAELNNLEPIKQKTRLIIMDALFTVINGGPTWSNEFIRPYNSILIATDPVAMDRVLLEIIDGLRKTEQLPPIAPQSKHVKLAADLGLGEGDLEKIDIVEIGLG
ncbi:DUF362 domain-containing protein [candidate division KSB1 bacterium]|nr:DUF362 domain-containing protein [candidate division KSB1 bacterium]